MFARARVCALALANMHGRAYEDTCVGLTYLVSTYLYTLHVGLRECTIRIFGLFDFIFNSFKIRHSDNFTSYFIEHRSV